MKLRKAAVALTGATLLVLAACTGGGSGGSQGTDDSNGSSGSEATIEFQTNLGSTDPILTVLREITDQYEAENEGVTIELVPMTDSYEADLRVRLASNDPPDIWSTHGWSLLRYSEFLEPLDDQPWAGDVNPALDAAMRDESGAIYALPANTDVAGIIYNKQVLADLGIDPESLTSWAEFDAALATISEAGITPIGASGRDSWFAGNVADFMASGFYDETAREQNLSGDFATEPYSALLEQVSSWAEADYFNVDYSSVPQDDLARGLAEGQIAFVFSQNYLVGAALGFDPDAELGYFPVPSPDGQPYLVGGEGYAYAVSKDSEHKDAALEYLAFLAQPENLGPLATAIGGIPGLTNASADLGPLQASYDQFVADNEFPLEPYFDRVYLPNGMWDTMVTTTDAIITGQSDVPGAISQLSSQFDTLFAQQ